MKTLFLLFYLLCQGVVALGDKDGNIGGKNVGDADSEILLTLTSDELPLALLRGTIDYTNVKIVYFAPSDETHLKIGPSLGDNAHLAVDAPLLGQGITYPVHLIIGERVVFKVDYRIRPGLRETTSRHQENDKYKKHSFHAAKILKMRNVECRMRNYGQLY